jgi:hypothetical protein
MVRLYTEEVDEDYGSRASSGELKVRNEDWSPSLNLILQDNVSEELLVTVAVIR